MRKYEKRKNKNTAIKTISGKKCTLRGGASEKRG